MKPDRKCVTCKKALRSPRLLDRIYNSSAFVPGGESLKIIAEDEKLSYSSLTNHVRKHQALTEEDLTKKQLNAITKKHKKLQIQRILDHEQARELIIEKGTDAIQRGEVQVKPEHVLQASKQQMEREERQKDRQLHMQEMIFAFASEEIKNEDDSATDQNKGRTVIDVTA